MKKFLSILALMLVVVCTLASCQVINTIFPKEYTVTFDLNGGEGGEGFSETVTVKGGETVTLPSPTRENHDFLGWHLDGALFNEGTAIESDITLKAEWTPNNIYTITYNTNGKAEVANGVFLKGELPKIPETPIVEGFVFFGWYLDEALTERYFFDYAFDEDLTLYAKFYDTTLGEYIVISNVEQLQAISEQPDAKYLLACDINCKGEALVPIDEFSGEFDGNGYAIFNFEMDETAASAGFVRTNIGTIKNTYFKDFIMDILVSGAANKHYGIVCGVNNVTEEKTGTIENCHVLNSEESNNTIRVNVSNSGHTSMSTHIGGVVGYNAGTVINCSNSATIDVTSSTASATAYTYVGGVIGNNVKDATTENCVNNGKVVYKLTRVQGYYNYSWDNYYATGTCYIGGIAGNNHGIVTEVENTADVDCSIVSPSNQAYIHAYVGGAVAVNEGDFTLGYSTGNVTLTGGSQNNLYVGGFVAYNKGKVYNCYTTGNVDCRNGNITSIGSFAGANILASGYPAAISKSFATGNIVTSVIPQNSGYFVGNTSGTEKHCYYLDTMEINKVTITETTEGEETVTTETFEPIETTCDSGTAKTMEVLTSVDFIENTLYFDRMVWFVYEGQLPSLR
ncbi:MAG: InlB B-repeat-containing protein [Clostridia bacterium]|nr:InlB B-repeat-containing protein [Clostridia bacterium]